MIPRPEPAGEPGAEASAADPSRPDASEARAHVGRHSTVVPMLLLALLALALPIVLLRSPLSQHMGWDESMHAELPAVRLLLSLTEPGAGPGFFEVLFDCQQYPFVYPALLAVGQGFGTIGEASARFASAMLWGVGLAGVLLLARQLRVGGRSESGRLVAAACALGFAASSPMAQAFARTLFLELPFASAMSLALLLWLRRGGPAEEGSALRELAAGCALTLACFTKFNYGALLLAALAADLALDALVAWRLGRLGRLARRAFWLALAPALVGSWWFVLPLPAGAQVAAAHRAAWMSFMSGNLELQSASAGRRLMHLAAYLAASPASLALAGLGLLASLGSIRERATRVTWLLLIALGAPVCLHPFHLERFWLPVGVPLWVLAGAGFGLAYARLGAGRGRRLAVGLFLLLALATPQRALDQSLWLAGRLGELPAQADARARARQVLSGWVGALGERVVPSAGLRESEAAAFLDLVAAEVGPAQHFGWLGLSSELSPAVLHLGLFERGGSPERLVRDATRALDIAPTPGAAEPSLDGEQFAAFARGFDLIFLTDPPDVKDRASRRDFRERWHRRLVEELGWTVRRLGVVPVERGGVDTLEVGLFVCRPPG